MQVIVGGSDAFEVVFGDEHAGKTEFVGFGDALGDAGDRANLAAQAHLAGETGLVVEGDVQGGRQDGGHDSHADGGVFNAQSACDVQEDVLGAQFEPASLLQHSQQHVQAADIVARGGPLRRAIHRRAHQRLRFDHHRAVALQNAGDGVAAVVFIVLGDKDFRWVCHLTKTVLEHLEDAQFGGRSKPVFDTTYHTVAVVLVALELQHRIHDVFQQFRAGQGSIFRDVTDKEDGAGGAFGEVLELSRALLQLGNGTRRRLNKIALHRLDGIHNENVGL